MCYIKMEIHGRSFDCIWQVIFKLSRVAELQFNTRVNGCIPIYASRRHIQTFLNTRYYEIRAKSICRMTLNAKY